MLQDGGKVDALYWPGGGWSDFREHGSDVLIDGVG